MAQDFVSLAAAYFGPSFATSWIQTILYAVFIRAGDPKPQPGSPRYVRDYRAIYTAVIVAWMLFTVYETDWNVRQAGDYYQVLGVPVDVDERALNSRYRRLTALYHPDKITQQSPLSAAESEAFFIRLKQARDVLVDPVKRFAYDRLGDRITHCNNCHTIGDYLWYAIFVDKAEQIQYVGMLMFLVPAQLFGYLKQGIYWRYLSLALMITFETLTITSPTFPPYLTTLLNPLLTRLLSHPPYLPFQTILMTRRLFIASYILLTQLSSLYPPSPSSSATASSAAELTQQLSQLAGQNLVMAQAADAQASRMLSLEVVPWAEDEEGLGRVKGMARRWLVDNTVRSDPEVRGALGRVLQRRREGVPHGARGTT